MKIFSIVITGGPGGGKTSSLPAVKRALELRGYGVVTVTEAATELISAGKTAVSLGSQVAFQSELVKLQIKKADRARQQARELAAETGKTVVILFDRGIQDSRGYVSAGDFAQVLDNAGIDESVSRDGCDAVFFLRSPAVDKPAAYTRENNAARTETPEQAAETDRRTFSGWQGCPVFSEFDNSCSFDKKIARLTDAVIAFLENGTDETAGKS